MVPTRSPRKIFIAVAVINGPREPIMLPKHTTKAGQQPEIRIPLQQPQHDDADDRDRVAEQHRRPAADDAVEPGDAEHAEQQYDAAEKPQAVAACSGGNPASIR